MDGNLKVWMNGIVQLEKVGEAPEECIWELVLIPLINEGSSIVGVIIDHATKVMRLVMKPRDTIRAYIVRSN